MLTCLEAERSVLGSLLLYGTKAVEAIQTEGLHPEAFWWQKHGAIAQACIDLHKKGLHVDHITVTRQMNGNVDRALLDLCMACASPAGLREHARYVLEDHEWRTLRALHLSALEQIKRRDRVAYQRVMGGRPALRVITNERAA